MQVSSNLPPSTAVLHLSCSSQPRCQVGLVHLRLALPIRLYPPSPLLVRDLFVRPEEERALLPVTACGASKEPPRILLLKEALKQQGWS